MNENNNLMKSAEIVKPVLATVEASTHTTHTTASDNSDNDLNQPYVYLSNPRNGEVVDDSTRNTAITNETDQAEVTATQKVWQGAVWFGCR